MLWQSRGEEQGNSHPLLWLLEAPKLTGSLVLTWELQNREGISADLRWCREGWEPVIREAASSNRKYRQGHSCGSTGASEVRQNPSDVEALSLLAEGSTSNCAATMVGDWLPGAGREFKSFPETGWGGELRREPIRPLMSEEQLLCSPFRILLVNGLLEPMNPEPRVALMATTLRRSIECDY